MDFSGDSRPPIETHLVGPHEQRALLGMALTFAILAVLVDVIPPGTRADGTPIPPINPWVFPFMVSPLVMVFVTLACHTRRIAGLGARVDDEGVSATMDDQVLWTVPWSRYGGYRRKSRPHGWRAAFDPSIPKLEILDREGVPIGELPLGARPSASSHPAPLAQLRRAEFYRRLDERASIPAPAPSPEPTMVPPKRSVVAAMLTLGIPSLAFGVWALFTVLPAWREGTAMPTPLSSLSFGGQAAAIAIPVLVGGVLSGMGAIYAHAWVRPQAYALPSVASPPLPEEGPSLVDHRLLTEDHPVEFEDGTRYRVVDPEERKRGLRQEVENALAGAVIGAMCFGMVAVLAFSAPPKSGEQAFTGLLFAVPAVIAWLSYSTWVTARARCAALQDTVVCHGGDVVVVRPDGTHLTFGPTTRRRRVVGVPKVELWRDGTNRYPMDRYHLYAAGTVTGPEEMETFGECPLERRVGKRT